MTKIYYGRDLIGRFTCDGRVYTKSQLLKMRISRAIKMSLTIAALIVISAWLVTGGIYLAKATIDPQIAYAERIVEVPIKEMPPILERIMDCESGARVNGKPVKGSRTHYDKNGQIITNSNGNSTDIGIAQINTYYHGKQATKMGFDLTKEQDNIAFAIWLFETQGSEPWSASRSCWLSS
jgi:hypothetical protein